MKPTWGEHFDYRRSRGMAAFLAKDNRWWWYIVLGPAIIIAPLAWAIGATRDFYTR